MTRAKKKEKPGKVKKSQEKELEKKSPDWKSEKNLLIGAGLAILLVIVVVFFAFYKGARPPESRVNMSLVKDLDAVEIRGDGLPGYDVNRDGKVDYLASGFAYYKGLYDAGGFEYGPGAIKLKEFDIEIILPELNFTSEDIRESGVGSVVEFSARDENTSVEANVILKTLGPSLSTYTLHVKDRDGQSYILTDLLNEEGEGTLQAREVDIVGRMIIRE